MLIQIRDRAALSSLSIMNLRSYLNSRGWSNKGPCGSRPATIYAIEHGGRNWEILVPTRDTIADYVESMAESVEVLAKVEERSQLDVFYDLLGAGADTIRVRSSNGVAREALSLRSSADLLRDTYDMLASAARAVERPQATYRGKISSDVANYLDSVRPLPGYHDGYVLTLHSPVPAGFGRQADMGEEFIDPPFPRRTTYKLAQALGHTSTALQEVVIKDTLEPFEQAVQYGVSANLCDSVAKLAKKGHGIDIDLVWAGVRRSSVIDSHFPFSQHSASILEAAAGHFRSKEPYINEYLIADVVRLEREPEQFDGRALILVWRDEPPFRIQVEFEESDYDIVILAHREKKLIGVYGDIYQEGRGHKLQNPRNLKLLDNEPLP